MSKAARGGRRTLPFAFTEHGALMAATVLNSPRAVAMTVYIIRAFVKMREVELSCPTSRQQLLLLLLFFPIRACSSCANASLYGLAECRNEKLNMKINQGVQISACSALLFLATVLQAGASVRMDAPSLLSHLLERKTFFRFAPRAVPTMRSF